LTHPS